MTEMWLRKVASWVGGRIVSAPEPALGEQSVLWECRGWLSLILRFSRIFKTFFEWLHLAFFWFFRDKTSPEWSQNKKLHQGTLCWLSLQKELLRNCAWARLGLWSKNANETPFIAAFLFAPLPSWHLHSRVDIFFFPFWTYTHELFRESEEHILNIWRLWKGKGTSNGKSHSFVR